MKSINKSRITQKNEDKDANRSPEEIKLKKLEDIIQKLQHAVEKGSNIEQRHQEQGKRNTTNKSNFSSPTSTRMKEDRSDREFLSNFMNIDEKNVIPPKKMHLLTDNDTSQNITAREKFQNLSNLMMDDKNITEFNFIRNSEDRIKLHLYSAFSKKSKEIFMNEKHPKQSKNQILFHKINDIHIPKFKAIIDSDEASDEDNSPRVFIEDLGFGDEPIDENEEINYIKNNLQKDPKEKDNKKFEDKYFRKENTGYFHIPSLIRVVEKPAPILKNMKKLKTCIIQEKKLVNFKKEPKKKDDVDFFWDPEIDSDTLSYINHNFICIEDIYNKKNVEEKSDKNKTEQNISEESEPNLTPIMAKELILEKEEEINKNFFEKEGKGGKDKKNTEENKVYNRFIEFIAINVGVAKQEYQVMRNIKSVDKFNAKLKNDFNELINKYIEIDKNEYPKGTELTPRRIERFLRFKFLRQESKQIDFSIGGKSTQQSEKKNISSSNENDEEKKDEKGKKDDKNFLYVDNESENDFNISINSKEKSQQEEANLEKIEKIEKTEKNNENV